LGWERLQGGGGISWSPRSRKKKRNLGNIFLGRGIKAGVLVVAGERKKPLYLQEKKKKERSVQTKAGDWTDVFQPLTRACGISGPRKGKVIGHLLRTKSAVRGKKEEPFQGVTWLG